MDADTSSSHVLITGGRILGSAVYSRAGERIGHVHDLSIQKTSGKVIYVLMSFGGFLGIGERIHPLPWSILDFDLEKGGYVVPLDKAQLQDAPSLTPEELVTLGGGQVWHSRIFEYYGPYGAMPYF